MDWLIDAWVGVQSWIFDTLVTPVLYGAGLMVWYEPAYGAVEIFMLGFVQLVVIATAMRFFERRRPLERSIDGPTVAVDRVYTVLNRLGIVPLAIFFLTYPLVNEIDRLVRAIGFAPPRLEHLAPWLHDNALLSFLLYFALYDFAAYWVHRAQHRFSWWWAIHSLHHSQRSVTVWTDDRNHILDDVIVTLVLAIFAQFVGVQPADYVAIVMVGRLIENWSHANVDMGFGRLGDRLIVGPRFHRVHHAMASSLEPHIHDHNFSPVFPLWDMLFGTALFERRYRPTGVDDPATDADNDKGWWGQQAAGFTRFFAALAPRLRRA